MSMQGRPGSGGTPPGWYQQPDGSQAYWDGYQWLTNQNSSPPVKKGIPAWGWILIVIGVVVVLCGGLGTIAALSGSGSDSATSTPSSPVVPNSPSRSVDPGLGSADAIADVTLGTPVIDTEFMYTATVPVIITNNSSKPSSYFVTIAGESADGTTRYDTSYATVDSLQPGQSTTQEAVFFTEMPAGSVFVIVEVERLAS